MYKITYINNFYFISKNPMNSHWGEINNIIKKIEYNLFGKKIILEGYESYNHLVVYNYTILSQKQFVSKIILLAKNGNQVIKFIFDIIKEELIIEKDLFRKEFGGQPSTGWKAGLYTVPKYQII